VKASLIRSRQKRAPFRPFELRLPDGERHPVRHPGQIAVADDLIFIVDTRGKAVLIAPEAVVSLGPVTNGARKQAR
jgi:hypothetical protein